ncbi:MAG: hypothetical protein ABI877_10140, partial [Gemmatimonadaceae bacterium]
MIKIGIKGLAKFMTSSAAQQRKILRDYKFPDEEGTAQAGYYREARHLVSEYHRHRHPAEWLRSKAGVLQATAAALGGRIATRLRHNARGIQQYATHFPTRRYDVLAERKLYYHCGNVRVTIVPDLHVREGERERLLRLEFTKDEPDPAVVKIISQLMFEAALHARLAVKSTDVLYVDVGRGRTYK